MRKGFLKIFRFLPGFRGKRRLARRLFGQSSINNDVQQIIGKFGCKYLVPNTTEHIGFELLISGIYEIDTIRLLSEIIPKNGVFLDIGANIGAILIPLATIRKDINIVAVEASPDVFEYLQKNIVLNSVKKTQLFNNAVYDQDGLVMDFFTPEARFGKGSLGTLFTNTSVKVKTRTIDSLIDNNEIIAPDAIKVDVEGFEYFVFNGGIKLLSRTNAPSILFEFGDWAEESAHGLKIGSAQSLLVKLGYTLFMFEGKNKIKMNEIVTKGGCNLFAVKMLINEPN